MHVLARRPVDRLVEVDDRAGDHLRRVAEQVGDRRGDVLVRPQQPAQRRGGVGGRQPVVRLALARLHDVLALRRGPADVQAVDADAIGLERVARVAGEGGERRLRRRVGHQLGRAAVRGHGDDVHDAAAAAPAHQPRSLLDEDERRADVDREQAVPQLDGRVVERAAGAEPGGVDEAVEAAEALLGAMHDAADLRLVLERGAHEHAVALQRVADRLAALPVAARDDDARGAERGRPARDRRAEALCRARDGDHAAVQTERGKRVSPSGPRKLGPPVDVTGHDTSSTRTARPSRSERQAARPMTSGARASTTPTGGVSRFEIAATNASHSRM